MKCRDNVERINQICTELLEIIDDSRAHCESDEHELIHCVVHDSVQNMRRVIKQRRFEGPDGERISIVRILKENGRSVN